MAYSPYLSQFMPQMGLLSGMYGGAAGSPGGAVMPNAAPQLPSWGGGGGGGGGGSPFAPILSAPTMPGSAGTAGGAQGASPFAALNDPAKMKALQGLLGSIPGQSDANPGMMGLLGNLFGSPSGYSGL